MEKINIAICDDDEEYRKILEGHMEKLRDIYHKIRWKTFNSAKEVWEYYQRNGNAFDILITDIEMSGMSGMSGIELANKVRERDRVVIIFYVTSHPHYATECFRAQPLDFWKKPVLTFDKVQVDFERAKDRMEESQRCLSFYENHERMVLSYDEIVYFETWNKRTIIYANGTEYTTNKSLTELKKEIDPNQFVRVNQSYIVNYAYIESYTNSLIKLRGISGEIKVTRIYSHEWKNGLFRYKTRRALE